MFGNCLVRDYVAKLGAKIKGGLSKLGIGHAHFNIASPLHSFLRRTGSTEIVRGSWRGGGQAPAGTRSGAGEASTGRPAKGSGRATGLLGIKGRTTEIGRIPLRAGGPEV